MGKDIISVIEAAYRVEQSEADWIAGIADAVWRVSLPCVGVGAYAYEISGGSRLIARSPTWRGEQADVVADELVGILAAVPPEYVAETWAKQTASLASEAPGFDNLEVMKTYFRPRGIADVQGVNGLDPTMCGCFVGVCLPRVGTSTRASRSTWTRVGTHMAAAFRIRRRLGELRSKDASHGAEAVFDPSGRVQHAEREATQASALEALRFAVDRMERARGPLRRREPEQAVEEWRGLVAARWSLVEHFERGGRRYLVARRNDPDAPGPDALTRRERQILAYAALGRTNKLIAYELGISASTVGVFMSRAMRKLRAKTRAEAITSWLRSAEG